MWRGDETPYDGQHYQLGRPLNSPNSVQRPHPPILIGGGGERRTLRLVAQYADACNLFDVPGRFAGDIPHKLAVLRDHCQRLGRDYGEIEKTSTTEFTLGEDRRAGLRQLVAHLRELAALGVGHALLSPQDAWDDETLDAIASIVPEVHAIPTAA